MPATNDDEDEYGETYCMHCGGVVEDGEASCIDCAAPEDDDETSD